MASDVLLVAILVLAAATAAVAVWAIRLHGRVQRLGRELAEAHEQLARTQKLGALGEMSASFAHSFNDVLTPIIGRTQLLGQRVTDPQLREWLETIERAAMQGAQTVRRIQEFMRLRREEPTVAVDLGATVRQALGATTARRRPEVDVKTDLAAVPPIAGDPLGLRDAIAHLLINAVEASPNGGRVIVSARMEGGEAVVSVADTGSGMTPETQARIFEPFFSTKPGATGLGLSLAHGIVSRHGGQIEIDSTPGRGTTVKVRFPVEGLGGGRATAAGRRAGGAAGPARCLVVDDDPQVRDMIRDILSNAGHQVVLAVDGSDGVEKFKADRFDVVISDLAMPKLNGLQLARVCKALRPAVPVVMLTGWGVLLTEDELAEHGVDEVLSKPVRMDQVLSTVAAVRERSGEG
ncbi:MAG: response regulator [Candidatus Rokubacteria bacterium]|nr:response regulator [Candidatus Rokubacteria bacterium]